MLKIYCQILAIWEHFIVLKKRILNSLSEPLFSTLQLALRKRFCRSCRGLAAIGVGLGWAGRLACVIRVSVYATKKDIHARYAPIILFRIK